MIEIEILDILNYYDEHIYVELDKKDRDMECAAKEILNIKIGSGKIKKTLTFSSTIRHVTIDLNEDNLIVNIELS